MTAADDATRAEGALRDVLGELTDPREGECLFCYVYRMLEFGCPADRLAWARRWRDLRAPRATCLARRLAAAEAYATRDLPERVGAARISCSATTATAPTRRSCPCRGVRRGSPSTARCGCPAARPLRLTSRGARPAGTWSGTSTGACGRRERGVDPGRSVGAMSAQQHRAVRHDGGGASRAAGRPHPPRARRGGASHDGAGGRFRHGRLALRIGARILDHVEGHGLGAVLAAETGSSFAGPDTSGSGRRFVAATGCPKDPRIPELPDLW